jgi:hypothetical protein
MDVAQHAARLIPSENHQHASEDGHVVWPTQGITHDVCGQDPDPVTEAGLVRVALCDRYRGRKIDERALEEPIRQIVENAGLEGTVIVERVKSETSPSQGYDAESMEYVDMLKAGIIDPTKVERVAQQNAASVASLLLTTEALITELPEEKPAAAPRTSRCRSPATCSR